MITHKIGVDGGGSKTHAVLFNVNGEILAEKVTSSANIASNLDQARESLITAIQTLLYKYNLDPHNVAIGIGVAGFSHNDNRHKLIEFLNNNFIHVKVASDAHIACLAAHNGHDGSVVICGTGVVGYYIKNGVGTQIGGWGFPHGDLGSGAWLGLEIARLLCKAIDGIIATSPMLDNLYERFSFNPTLYKKWLQSSSPKEYAELARLLPDYLNNQDLYALEVFKNGYQEIVNFIKLIEMTSLPLKISGGLANLYYPSLLKEFPNLLISDTPNAYGASYLT